MKLVLLILVTCLLALSCTPSPQPIQFGSDMCHFCKMTIVDNQHAAEVVTDKGKVFKFDAIECMIPFVAQSVTDFSFILVSDYSNPNGLINANESYFLISPNIPSPMGAFLSAFPNFESAQIMASQKEGEIYDWNDIQHRLSSDYSKL